MSDFLNSAVLLALVAAVPGILIAVLGHIKSGKVDKGTAQALVTTNQFGASDQVINAMDRHMKNLQDDNNSLREGMRQCDAKIERLVEEVALLTKALAKDISDNPRLT